MAFDRLQDTHQRWLQAGDIDAFGLLQEAVGGKSGKTGSRRHLIKAAAFVFVEVDVALVVHPGSAPDLEQSGLANAGQRAVDGSMGNFVGAVDDRLFANLG